MEKNETKMGAEREREREREREGEGERVANLAKKLQNMSTSVSGKNVLPIKVSFSYMYI